MKSSWEPQKDTRELSEPIGFKYVLSISSLLLVGGIPTSPLWKMMGFVSWDHKILIFLET